MSVLLPALALNPLHCGSIPGSSVSRCPTLPTQMFLRRVSGPPPLCYLLPSHGHSGSQTSRVRIFICKPPFHFRQSCPPPAEGEVPCPKTLLPGHSFGTEPENQLCCVSSHENSLHFHPLSLILPGIRSSPHPPCKATKDQVLSLAHLLSISKAIFLAQIWVAWALVSPTLPTVFLYSAFVVEPQT